MAYHNKEETQGDKIVDIFDDFLEKEEWDAFWMASEILNLNLHEKKSIILYKPNA